MGGARVEDVVHGDDVFGEAKGMLTRKHTRACPEPEELPTQRGPAPSSRECGDRIVRLRQLGPRTKFPVRETMRAIKDFLREVLYGQSGRNEDSCPTMGRNDPS